MTTKLGGVPITGFLSTTDDIDVYPTHLDELGKGGLHSATDIVSRDNIPNERRTEGMLCYVLGEMSLYQLSGGIDNINWLLIFSILDGEVIINNELPRNYIFHGDTDDETVKSPVLLDARLDILRIKAANFILGRPNEQLNSAQVLSNLQDGYMYNNNGIVSINNLVPTGDLLLTEGKVLRGDITNKASEVQRLEFNNMATFSTVDPTLNLGVYNIMTGSANPLTLGEPVATKELQQSNLPDLTVGSINIGAAITPLEDPLNYGFNRPKQVDKLPTDFLEVPFNKVIIGNVFDRASSQDRIELQNMAPLTFRTIWRGNLEGFPEETNDFTNLELKVETLEDITIPSIEADIAAIEAEIVTLQGQIAAAEAAIAGLGLEIVGIQGELILTQGAIAILQGQVLVLESQLQDVLSRLGGLENNIIPGLQAQINLIDLTLVSLQNQIDNLNTAIGILRLNNILADANVSFYGFKLIDLADPTTDTDGVNLQTLKEYRPYINIYNDNNLNITGVSANTLSPAICNTVPKDGFLFLMTADNTIIYQGLKPLVFNILATISINRINPGNNSDLSIAMYKNGNFIIGSLNTLNSLNAKSYNLNTCSLELLETGDEIRMHIGSTRNESLLVSRTSITITAA